MTAPSAPPPTAAAVERLRALLAKRDSPLPWHARRYPDGTWAIFDCDVTEMSPDGIKVADIPPTRLGFTHPSDYFDASLIAEGISALPGLLDQLDAQAKALSTLRVALEEIAKPIELDAIGHLARRELAAYALKEATEGQPAPSAPPPCEACGRDGEAVPDGLRNEARLFGHRWWCPACGQPVGCAHRTAPSAPAAGGEVQGGAQWPCPTCGAPMAEGGADHNAPQTEGLRTQVETICAGLETIVGAHERAQQEPQNDDEHEPEVTRLHYETLGRIAGLLRDALGSASDRAAFRQPAPPASRTPPEAGAAPGGLTPWLPPYDAPAGCAWLCPDCKSWATLSENAHAHQIATGHGKPTHGDAPEAP